jgi:hypothetical protein
MKLSHALIVSAAMMVVAPVYAQSYDNQPPQQRQNNDNQRTQQREVTTKAESKRVAPRSEHVVAHRSRYSSQEERRITADLNRHGVEARDSSGDHRDDQR